MRDALKDNELIEIDSNNIDAERYLARSKRSTGDELGAFEGYSRILQMEPEDTESLLVADSISQKGIMKL